MKAIWRTKAGERIPVKDLSESHLVNILKLYSKENPTLAIYDDHNLNVKQLKNILLNGKFTVCNVKKELLAWGKDKIASQALDDLYSEDIYLDDGYDFTADREFLRLEFLNNDL